MKLKLQGRTAHEIIKYIGEKNQKTQLILKQQRQNARVINLITRLNYIPMQVKPEQN